MNPLLGISVNLRDVFASNSAVQPRQDVYPTLTYTVTITGAAAMATAAAGPLAGVFAAAALLL